MGQRMGNTQLTDNVRKLMDLEEIRDLTRRYAHCVWNRDIDGAIDLFADDGVMDTGGQEPIKGRQRLLETYREMLGEAVFLPFVHNHLIEIDGDHATGICYLDLRSVVDGKSMVGAGRYDDVYERSESGWCFRSRKLSMNFFVPLDQGWATEPDLG